MNASPPDWRKAVPECLTGDILLVNLEQTCRAAGPDLVNRSGWLLYAAGADEEKVSLVAVCQSTTSALLWVKGAPANHIPDLVEVPENVLIQLLSGKSTEKLKELRDSAAKWPTSGTPAEMN